MSSNNGPTILGVPIIFKEVPDNRKMRCVGVTHPSNVTKNLESHCTEETWEELKKHPNRMHTIEYIVDAIITRLRDRCLLTNDEEGYHRLDKFGFFECKKT
jgi:hypothetical protein